MSTVDSCPAPRSKGCVQYSGMWVGVAQQVAREIDTPHTHH